MKKIVTIIVLMVTISMAGLASAAEVVDFQRALALAFENNIDLKISQLTLANSVIDWERNLLSNNADTRVQKLNMALELERNKDTERAARFNLVYGLINDFAELTKRRQTVEVAENTLKIREMELKRVSELYARGSATHIDLTNARTDVEDQKLTLHKSREDQLKLMDTLKTKTGLTGNVQFKELTPQILLIALDQNKAIEEALASSLDVKDRQIRYELASLDLEKAQLEGKAELELKKLANSEEIARLRYVLAKDDVTQKVKDHLWNLSLIATTIEIKTTELGIAKENYRLIETGYGRGFYTETQLLQNKNTLLNAERALYNAQVDYILRTAQLYRLLGKEEVIGGDLK